MADLRSDWGGGGRITITEAITAPGGQKLALNATGDGVLVWYDDGTGKARCMAVALAANRDATTAWQNVRTDIVAMTNYGNDPFIISIGMTDAQLNAVGFNDRFSGKSNTTHMSVTDSPAADFVRSKKIGGVACSLPNIQQMKRIYALKAEIDALDPTAKANPTTSLNLWSFSASLCAWSSTEADANNAWYVDQWGHCNCGGGDGKSDRCGVIPILELNPTTLRPL